MFSNNEPDSESDSSPPTPLVIPTKSQLNESKFNEDIAEITSKMAKLNAIEARRKSFQKCQSDSVFVVDSNRASKYLKKMFELEKKLLKFEPKCDGRIII